MPVTLAFRDFVPRDRTRMLALSRTFETSAEVLARANAWIAAEGIEPLNVETLLLPGAPAGVEESPWYVELNAGPLALAQWHQVVRVWYRIAAGSQAGDVPP